MLFLASSASLALTVLIMVFYFKTQLGLVNSNIELTLLSATLKYAIGVRCLLYNSVLHFVGFPDTCRERVLQKPREV